jgi:hypothetical protein
MLLEIISLRCVYCTLFVLHSLSGSGEMQMHRFFDVQMFLMPCDVLVLQVSHMLRKAPNSL